MPVKDQRRAYAWALATVACWSSVASAFKIALRELEVPQLLLVANLVSVMVLSLLLWGGGKLQFPWRISNAASVRALGLGLMNPVFYYLLLFQGYSMLPAQVAQPVNYTWVIALSLLAVPLLGQRIGVAELLAAIIAYAGVLVVSLGSAPGPTGALRWDGIGVVLLSTVVWALYWIANSRMRGDEMWRIYLNFCHALPFSFLACLLLSDLRIPLGQGLLAAVWVGVFEMGVAFVFWQRALSLSVNAARVSNLVFLSPIISLFLITLVLGEPLAPTTIPGLALILAGLLVQQRYASRA